MKSAALSFHDSEESLFNIVGPRHDDLSCTLSEHVPEEEFPVLIEMLYDDLRCPRAGMAGLPGLSGE